jgi:hypothetical protein
MLTRRFVLILAAVTLIVTAAAVAAQYARWSETIRSVTSEPAFPDIGAELAAVSRIKIIRADDHPDGSFTFSRTGDHWTMDEKGGFPATESVIRAMLLGFTDLQLVEAKTRDPKRFVKLNLSDTDTAGSKTSRVVLEDAGGKVLLDALFGKRVPSISGGKPSIYLRRQGDNQTWLATGEIEIRAGALEWLPNSLASIERERTERVSLRAPDEEPLELIYNDTHKRFEIADLPDTLKVSSQYRLLQVGILQERLAFLDVRPSEGLTANPALGGAVWRTTDGLTLTLDLARDPNDADQQKVWALISVEVAPDAEEKVAKEGADIAARTKGWAYWLGDDALKKIWAKRADLVEPK